MSTNEQTNEAGGGTVIFRTPLASGKFPSARGGHSTVVFEGKLIVFGGHYHKGDGVFVYENDTYVLNLRTLKWKLVRTKGDVPRPRYGHSATVFGEEMYVFGGRGKGGKNFRDMDCLNLKTMTWRKIRSANALPPGRSGHSTTLIGDKLVIFGGFDGKHTLDDLWVFNISTTTWMRPKTTGRGPKSSHGHTCILSEEGGLVVFGGYHVPGIMKLPQYLNEVRGVRARNARILIISLKYHCITHSCQCTLKNYEYPSYYSLLSSNVTKYSTRASRSNTGTRVKSSGNALASSLALRCLSERSIRSHHSSSW